MALLTATDRVRLAAAYQRELSGSWAFTKPELAAAVAAVDQWVEDNTASFNTALPAAFRTKATVAQKVCVLAYVLMRRIGKARVAEDG